MGSVIGALIQYSFYSMVLIVASVAAFAYNTKPKDDSKTEKSEEETDKNSVFAKLKKMKPYAPIPGFIFVLISD